MENSRLFLKIFFFHPSLRYYIIFRLKKNRKTNLTSDKSGEGRCWVVYNEKYKPVERFYVRNDFQQEREFEEVKLLPEVTTYDFP